MDTENVDLNQRNAQLKRQTMGMSEINLFNNGAQSSRPLANILRVHTNLKENKNLPQVMTPQMRMNPYQTPEKKLKKSLSVILTPKPTPMKSPMLKPKILGDLDEDMNDGIDEESFNDYVDSPMLGVQNIGSALTTANFSLQKI